MQFFIIDVFASNLCFYARRRDSWRIRREWCIRSAPHRCCIPRRAPAESSALQETGNPERWNRAETLGAHTEPPLSRNSWSVERDEVSAAALDQAATSSCLLFARRDANEREDYLFMHTYTYLATYASLLNSSSQASYVSVVHTAVSVLFLSAPCVFINYECAAGMRTYPALAQTSTAIYVLPKGRRNITFFLSLSLSSASEIFENSRISVRKSHKGLLNNFIKC